jgi:hypothetical protein
VSDRIVAIGLLTQRDLTLLGPTFEWAWSVDEAPEFSELLRAIDEADGKLQEQAGITAVQPLGCSTSKR